MSASINIRDNMISIMEQFAEYQQNISVRFISVQIRRNQTISSVYQETPGPVSPVSPVSSSLSTVQNIDIQCCPINQTATTTLHSDHTDSLENWCKPIIEQMLLIPQQKIFHCQNYLDCFTGDNRKYCHEHSWGYPWNYRENLEFYDVVRWLENILRK